MEIKREVTLTDTPFPLECEFESGQDADHQKLGLRRVRQLPGAPALEERIKSVPFYCYSCAFRSVASLGFRTDFASGVSLVRAGKVRGCALFIRLHLRLSFRIKDRSAKLELR
jgi:hypothetical protein